MSAPGMVMNSLNETNSPESHAASHSNFNSLGLDATSPKPGTCATRHCIAPNVPGPFVKAEDWNTRPSAGKPVPPAYVIVGRPGINVSAFAIWSRRATQPGEDTVWRSSHQPLVPPTNIKFFMSCAYAA